MGEVIPSSSDWYSTQVAYVAMAPTMLQVNDKGSELGIPTSLTFLGRSTFGLVVVGFQMCRSTRRERSLALAAYFALVVVGRNLDNLLVLEPILSVGTENKQKGYLDTGT